MTPPNGPTSSSHPVLLYDDECKFCRASAALVRAWDHREALDLLPLSDRRATSLLAPMTPAQQMRSIHVVEPDGSISSAGSAVIALCRDLPGVAWIPRTVASRPLLGTLIGRAYTAIAAARGALASVVPECRPVSRWRSD